LKGKIVSYDQHKGQGKILTQENNVKIFFQKNWNDISLPKIGAEVEFDIIQNKLQNIHSLNTTLNIEQLNYPIKYNLPTLNIKPNIPMEQCLDEFFLKFKKLALKYEERLNVNKQLPYIKLKRFILTAYNNLIEIDVSIGNKELISVKNQLDEIEKYYSALLSEIKNPISITFQKFFLNRQHEYLAIKRQFEKNKNIISESTVKAKALEEEIKSITISLQKLNPKTEIYEEKEKNLKNLKKQYVDLIDRAQNLKEENSQIIEDILKFEQNYLDIFKNNFTKKAQILEKIILKELDVTAYQFDTILWKNAKNSKSIQHFFKEAKIEGSYSTKTFMKYYLKNLDQEKINSKDIELLEILNELKIFTKNIVIYDKNKNRASDISRKIENIDHDSSVKIFDDIKELVWYIKDNDGSLDVAILEIEKNNEVIINKILEILEKLNIKIILFSDSIEKEEFIPGKDLIKKIKNLI